MSTNIPSKEWFVYKIFVSSTFKDMDQERDIIKFSVISRLNERYKNLKIQFQVIDLRIGINTENLEEKQRDNYVLDSCMKNIDNARPFFIGLLGEHYGWIPPSQRWRAVVKRLDREKRILLEGCKKKSVTELEIMYGAIGDKGKYINHSLFFFRDHASYDNVPKELIPIYVDQSVHKQIKNKLLKTHIAEIADMCQQSDICVEYHLTWNSAKGMFDGLEGFSNILFEKLCREIDNEIRDRRPPQSWIEQDLLNKEFLLKKNISNKTRRNQCLEISKMVADGKQVFLTGKQGCGKSVFFSQIVTELNRNTSYKCLSAFVGMSPFSQTMHSIVRSWIVELGGDELDEKEEEKKVKEIFFLYIDKIQKRGKRVVAFLDGVEKFYPVAPKDIFLLWIPENISFLGTIAESVIPQVIKYHQGSSLVTMEPLNDCEINVVIKQYEEYYNICLPEKFRAWLCYRKPEPICINLIFTIISNLSYIDFHNIRNIKSGSKMEQINDYIMGIINQSPYTDAGQMLKYAINKVADNYGCEIMVSRALTFIACSGGGLCETDLEKLMDKEWDSLRFHSIMSVFNDYFYCDQDYQRWHFQNSYYSNVFIPKDLNDCSEISKEIAQLFLSYDDDDKQKNDLLFYHLLKSGQADLSRGIMTDIETEHRMGCGGWYRISMYYILSENNLNELIRNLCKSFSSNERVGFIHYFKYFLPAFSHYNIILDIVENNLNNVNYVDLCIKNSYDLAYLYGDLFQSTKYPLIMGINVNESKSLYYLERSIEGFSKCYSFQPDYKDSKNMLSCMISEMLPILAEKNEFTKIQNYISIINNLN